MSKPNVSPTLKKSSWLVFFVTMKKVHVVIVALDKLVTHNLGLVNKIVNVPPRNASCTFEDLFQEGVTFDSRYL